jgi:hypothetical protein
MSTRSIIGTYDNKTKGEWHGVYHHWDGYPTGVGKTLLSLFKKKGVNFIRKEIIEKHPEGWSTINRNWNKKPINTRKAHLSDVNDDYKAKPPEHYDPKDDFSRFLSQKDEPGIMGSEYLYLVHEAGVDVFYPEYIRGDFKGSRMIGAFGMGAPDIGRGKDVKWTFIGTVRKSHTLKVLKEFEEKSESSGE